MSQAIGQKPFSFSWSKLKNYRTCPKRHYEIDLAKNYKEKESEALQWGNQIHDAMAKFIEKGAPLPATMQRYRMWPENVRKLLDAGYDVKVEQQLAIAKDFGPSGYFAPDAWFRAKLDVTLFPGTSDAITIDWKTGGKVQPEFEQLALSAQTIFAHHPEINQVASIYVWFGHDTQTVKIYKRDEMAPIWNELWPTIKMMEDAWKTTTYPAKPSGLCINYCPVTNCPFYGKGNR